MVLEWLELVGPSLVPLSGYATNVCNAAWLGTLCDVGWTLTDQVRTVHELLVCRIRDQVDRAGAPVRSEYALRPSVLKATTAPCHITLTGNSTATSI